MEHSKHVKMDLQVSQHPALEVTTWLPLLHSVSQNKVTRRALFKRKEMAYLWVVGVAKNLQPSLIYHRLIEASFTGLKRVLSGIAFWGEK